MAKACSFFWPFIYQIYSITSMLVIIFAYIIPLSNRHLLRPDTAASGQTQGAAEARRPGWADHEESPLLDRSAGRRAVNQGQRTTLHHQGEANLSHASPSYGYQGWPPRSRASDVLFVLRGAEFRLRLWTEGLELPISHQSHGLID